MPKSRNERAIDVGRATKSQSEMSCKQPITKELKDMIAIPLLTTRVGVQPIRLKLWHRPVRSCSLFKHHGIVDDLRAVVTDEGVIVAATT